MQVSASTNAADKTARAGQPVFPAGEMTLFVLVTVLFVLWGMSNNLTDILVQQFKKSFELSQCFADVRRDTPSGYVGCLRHWGKQFLPFHHVPDNLRARTEGAR